jgi:DNA invertase Pin-like site-specific DNA recombinase
MVQVVAAVRAGDTFVLAKLDRFARSVPDARGICDSLSPIGCGCRLAGRSTTGPTRWGGCSSSSWPPFAEFGVDPLRMRARGGMAVARAKGRLWGRQLKLSARRQARLAGLHAAGEHAVADLAGLFSVSWPAVYRVLERVGGRPAAGSGAEGRQHRG